MRLIKLTCVPHPDIDDGKPRTIYVDPTRILTIERARTSLVKEGSQEQHRQAIQGLFEEVERIVAEASTMKKTMVPTSEEEARWADQWMFARESAAALQSAYQIVARVASGPAYYPRVDCTVVSMACGTGLEHGVMLARAEVTETPEEIAALMERATLCPNCGAGTLRSFP